MSAAKKKNAHFEIKPILRKFPKARYYFLLGARSCGKTYPCIKKAIEDAVAGRGVFAYIRRRKESITDTAILDLMAPHHAYIEKLTGGAWNHIGYFRHRWYLEYIETREDGTRVRTKRSDTPIGIALSMSTWETDKGSDFGADKGGVTNIIVDEVFSKGGSYLKDEWDIFTNIISTLVRDRWELNTKIFLLANPVSKYGGHYIRNFGITKKMRSEFGTYEIRYPDASGKVSEKSMSAVFIYIAARTNAAGETIDIDDTATQVYNSFFAFQHSKGKQLSVTHGFWEMEDAATLPKGVYNDSEKRRTIYITFDEELIAVDCMKYTRTGIYYLFIRPTEKIPKNEYFITLGMSLEKKAIIGLKTGHPVAEYLNKIARTNQMYYSDLETADIWHGFLLEAKKRVA